MTGIFFLEKSGVKVEGRANRWGVFVLQIICLVELFLFSIAFFGLYYPLTFELLVGFHYVFTDSLCISLSWMTEREKFWFSAW